MSETKRVSNAQIVEQMQSIKNACETIALAISEMPDCGAKKSLSVTLAAIAKKVEKYTAEAKPRGSVAMSDEEKELLRKFRAGEIEVKEKEVSTVSANVVDSSEVEQANFNEPEKKGKRKH